MRKHIFKHRRILACFAIGLGMIAFFSQPEAVHAQFAVQVAESSIGVLQKAITGLINLLLNALLYVVVWLFSVCVGGLQYLLTSASTMNDLPELITGWRIVRNTMNSFFIVVLIAIAISTIIRFQQFNFRTTLPRLILAAFLVNFSRTICLLAINASNALMVAFGNVVAEALPIMAVGLRLPAVAAFSDASLGGLFGIDDESILGEGLNQGGGEFGEIGLTVTLILGLIVALVAVGAIAFFLVILLFRVIVLWFLTMLSPLAFFLWGVPGRASSYWGQWLNEFVQHLIVGPVAAFFLYIILTLMIANVENNYGTLIDSNIPAGTSSLISQPQVMLGYFIGLGMMFVALEIIQQMGVRGGNFAERVGVDGIIKGGMRLAGYANDYLYSKGLSVKPIKAIEGIRAGIVGRQAKLVTEGDRVFATRVGAAEGKGAGVRSLLWATASGDQEFFENNGLPQFTKRLGLGALRTGFRGGRALTRPGETFGSAVSWAGQKFSAIPALRNRAFGAVSGGISSLSNAIQNVESLEELQTMEEGIDNRFRARTAASLWSANATSRVSGFDRSGVDQSLNYIKKYEDSVQAKERVDELQKAKDKAKNKTEWTKENGQTLADAIQAYASLQTDPETVIGEQLKDHKSVFEDAQKLYNEKVTEYDDEGNPTGGTIAIDNGISAQDTETVGNIVARLTSSQVVADDTKKRERILPEMVARLTKSEAALASAKATFSSRISDIRNKMYPHGEEHDEVELANTARAHMNPRDRAEFAAPLIQAAEEGKFEAVVQLLDNKINLTNAGMKVFDSMLKNKLNMNNEEINELKMKVQAFAKKSGMHIQGALTKDTTTGRRVAATQADRAAVVAKVVRNKRGVYQALASGKLEAFTTKVNGKPRFEDEFWLAVKQNSGALNEMLKNKGGQLANVPPELLKALSKQLSDPKFSYLVDKSGIDNLKKFAGR